MTFTENFKTGIVGMGAEGVGGWDGGKSRGERARARGEPFILGRKRGGQNSHPLAKCARRVGHPEADSRFARNDNLYAGYEKEKQIEVDYGMQGTGGVGGALFHGAGEGVGVGSVEAVWGVGAV